MPEQATDDTRNTTFALVYHLIELALILPVATATAERAFSAMKIIKTDTQNKMRDEWLNYRMTCYIERDVFASITNDDILQYFQELKSCLKKLPKTVQYQFLWYITFKLSKKSYLFCFFIFLFTFPSCPCLGVTDEEMQDVTANAPNHD